MQFYTHPTQGKRVGGPKSGVQHSAFMCVGERGREGERGTSFFIEFQGI